MNAESLAWLMKQRRVAATSSGRASDEGMLFLKRASNLFDQRREEFKREGKAAGLSDADIALNLEDPDQYSGQYFFVPPRARWNDG
jgi:type I restriction-modification system DNA methylase subunit